MAISLRCKCCESSFSGHASAEKSVTICNSLCLLTAMTVGSAPSSSKHRLLAESVAQRTQNLLCTAPDLHDIDLVFFAQLNRFNRLADQRRIVLELHFDKIGLGR